jgi:hypothetical protein
MNQTIRRGARGFSAFLILLLPVTGGSIDVSRIAVSGAGLQPLIADWQEKTDSAAMMANKEAIVEQLNKLSAQVYLYRVRPKEMGGGEGTYQGFSIPAKMASTEDASFASTVSDSNHIRITASSAKGFGTVAVTVNEFGVLVDWSYEGQFREGVKPSAASISENKDAIINYLNKLADYAYQFRTRPKSTGGGEGSYMGVQLPLSWRSNENATYSIDGVAADTVKFMAISAYGYGVVTMQVDQDGRPVNWYFTDEFK